MKADEYRISPPCPLSPPPEGKPQQKQEEKAHCNIKHIQLIISLAFHHQKPLENALPVRSLFLTVSTAIKTCGAEVLRAATSTEHIKQVEFPSRFLLK